MSDWGGTNFGGTHLGGTGGTGGTGGAGGTGGTGSLADHFANPLTVRALMMTRDGIFEPAGPHHPRPAHGKLDDPDELENWDPWVRASLLQSELNQDLSFAPAGPDAMTLEFKSGPFFTLTRPPPSFLENQLPLVQSWAALREERMPEILTQIDNQVAFIAALTGLNVKRQPWTWEWLSAALSLVIPVEVRFKHALACRRPVAYSPQVQPIITTPGHGTYPMGHAAQMYMMAEALKVLLCLSKRSSQDSHPQAIQLERLAERVSINRIVAGVHFPVDAHAGRALGRAMARHFLSKCGMNFPTADLRPAWSGFGQNLQDEDPTQWDFPSDVVDQNEGLHERHTGEAPALELEKGEPRLLARLTQLALREWQGPAKRDEPRMPCGPAAAVKG